LGAYDHAFYIKSKKLSKIEQIAKKKKNVIAEKDLYNIIKLDSTLRLPKNSIFKIYNKTNPSCYDFCLHLSDFIDDYHKIKFLTGDYKGFECYLKHTIVDDKIIIELNDYISEDLSNITPYFNNEQLTYISDLEKTKKSLNPKR